PARHAGTEVPPRGAEHDHVAARHVLAAVVADGVHDRVHSAVAHAEALARHAADVRLSARRAVEGYVADDDVLLGHERSGRGRLYDDLAAGQALAAVIVGVTLEHEGHALRHEAAEALPRGA